MNRHNSSYIKHCYIASWFKLSICKSERKEFEEDPYSNQTVHYKRISTVKKMMMHVNISWPEISFQAQQELYEDNEIRVNCLCPSFVKTEMTKYFQSHEEEAGVRSELAQHGGWLEWVSTFLSSVIVFKQVMEIPVLCSHPSLIPNHTLPGADLNWPSVEVSCENTLLKWLNPLGFDCWFWPIRNPCPLSCQCMW